MKKTGLVLGLVMASVVTTGYAQTAGSRCAKIASDTARLACYDRIYPPAKKATGRRPKENRSPDPTADPNKPRGSRG